jgi:hypothetical protein
MKTKASTGEERDDVLAPLRLAVERASSEAQYAERRYMAVDPDNRLIARTLEAPTAICLVAASLFGPAAFARNPEAEAAAARAAAAAAAARANVQVSPNDPLEKICRIGPRSREVEVQNMEPFKVFDNLYHVGPCYVSSWVLKTWQGAILFDTARKSPSST